jgi:putative endonuclease
MNPAKYKKTLGARGELLAMEYLQKAGYHYLTGNFHTPKGEIDLIFMDGKTLVLVEVKTRNPNPLQKIEYTIPPKRINRILKTAETYIEKSGIEFSEIRVDAIFIEITKSGHDIRHYQDFNTIGSRM